MTKILWAASSGGHLQEILKLKDVAKQHSSILLTESSGSLNNYPFFDKVYRVSQINRKEKNFLVKLLKLFFVSHSILKKEKPDIVVSTGALATVPVALIAKINKSKVIYIESFARITTPSLTGKIMYHFADIFIIQWKELKKIYPNAIFLGGIF